MAQNNYWDTPAILHLGGLPAVYVAILAAILPSASGWLWYRERKRDAGLVTDEMVEKLSLYGTPQQCRQRLTWMIERGVYPIIYPIPRPDRVVEDHFETIRRAASYLS